MKKYFYSNIVILLIFTILISQLFGVVAAQNDGIIKPSKIPVIISFVSKANEDDKMGTVVSVDGEITRKYKIIHGVAALVPQARMRELQMNPLVLSVDQDVQVKALDKNANNQIRADPVLLAGNTGKGIPVAILDSGIDNNAEFFGRISKCHSEITNTDTCNDQHGHGTHVAGIVGAAGVNLQAKGVAPEVSYYIDQVLDANGSGSVSGIIAGIDWATANGAKVISMSLGSGPVVTTEPNCDNNIYGFSSLRDAINNAVAHGVTVVAAAGNSGAYGVGAPACISTVIAVGAVNSINSIADFSSRGGPLEDHGIVAPGVNIYSTMPTYPVTMNSYPYFLKTNYDNMSGTSMATPFISGTIALILNANPALSPSQIKNILFTTSCSQSTAPECPTGTVPNTVYGYGRVDALRAYNSIAPSDFSLSPSPNSLTIQNGNSNSSIITVTSLNGFNSPVTFSLSGNPAGMTSSFSPGSIAPPYGSSATSTLTINVDPSTPTGVYALSVTGVSGSLTHATTLILTVTPQSTRTLSVSIATDKTSYKRNSNVIITVTANANSIPLNGASITLDVTNPRGGIKQFSGTTGANGQVIFKYKIVPNAPIGTYTVTAEANAPDFNRGIASKTFYVS